LTQEKNVLFQSVLLCFSNLITLFIYKYFVLRYNQYDMSMVSLESMDDLKSLPKTKWNILQPADNDVREDALSTGIL
jgi:hypothetical protein